MVQNTKTPRAWKYEENMKKITKSPISSLGPKIRKQIPKNYKIGQKMTIFVIVRYFFRIFGAKPEMGDFVIFSYFFRISRLEGFLYSVPPRRDRNTTFLKHTSCHHGLVLFKRHSSPGHSVKCRFRRLSAGIVLMFFSF